MNFIATYRINLCNTMGDTVVYEEVDYETRVIRCADDVDAEWWANTDPLLAKGWSLYDLEPIKESEESDGTFDDEF